MEEITQTTAKTSKYQLIGVTVFQVSYKVSFFDTFLFLLIVRFS